MKAFLRLVGGGFFLTSDIGKKKQNWTTAGDMQSRIKEQVLPANPLSRFQPQWSLMQRTDGYKDLPDLCAVCSLPGTITVNNTVLYSTTEHWL